MNKFSLLSILLIGSLTSCTRDDRKTDEPVPSPAPQFSAKHGLLLPEETQRSLGLKLVEVAERSIESPVSFPVRVYQIDSAAARASGDVTPEEANQLKAGQSVELTKPDGGVIKGITLGLSRALQSSSGTVELLVEFPGDDKTFELGAVLAARISVQSKGPVTTIPKTALLESSEGPCVYVVSGERFVRTAVKVGGTNPDVVEVTDGLYAGDQVVAQPVMSLWMTELAAVKGGQSCCIEPPKGK